MRLSILILVLLSFSSIINAQQCQGPGRAATSAEAVCGTLVFHQKNLSNCSGQSIPNPTAGCGNIVTSDNGAWYKFHCYQAGNLGFLLTPLGIGDDYDWEIMDVTGHDPNDVFIMELRVSLNLSGVTGPTGCTAAGNLDVHCAGGPAGSQFNAMPLLQTGHDYLLMVNNYSQTGLGYDITFSGTAVLTSNTAPTIANVSIVGCDASKVKVTFSEDILCGSLTTIPSGTEFSVTNGTNIITGIVSDCSVGANAVPSVIINFQTTIPGGNYQLNVANGTPDGNTLSNVCGLFMLPVSIPFTVPTIVPVAVNNITFTGCAPTVLDVKLTKPVWCSSVTTTGSTEFTIMPGNIAVTSVVPDCSGSPVPYASMLHLTLPSPLPGGNYQLVINNGADGNTLIDTCGNTITIGNSTPFAIALGVPPKIQSLVYDECHRDRLVVNFDKPIACASLATGAGAGSEFSIVPAQPWSNITGIVTACGSGATTSQITLLFQGPVSSAQTFNVVIKQGADGNTLSDACLAFMPVGDNKSITTTLPPRPIFDSVQLDKCNTTFVKAFFSHPILCSSILANGTQFSLVGPSTVNIISATGDATCTQGYTRWILLQLAAPVAVAGNYNLTASNIVPTVVDTCQMAQLQSEVIAVNILGKPSAVFTSQVKFGCIKDTVTFTHPGGNGVNSWTWLFPDGSTATGQTVTQLFPVSTPSVTVQLTVNNGFCSDVISQTITLGNAFNAQFDTAPNDTVCINAPLIFTNTSPGNNLQYLWDFGDNTQFTGQTPPPHQYAVSGTYNVKMRATDPYGCWDEAGGILEILPAATIDFTGLAPQYCSDKTISLTKVSSSTILTYTWDNGDGMTVQNKPTVQFTYPKEGIYTIKLSSVDKYCGNAVVSKTVQIYEVPVVNLGNDTILCPSMTLQIGPAPINGYTYLWSNGATTSQILTDLSTTSYSLQVDNHGCSASDAISVKVLGACIIAVPNAFTPNNDNINDKLRPTNADLAKELSFRVYNRYGELIFATTNPLEGWNGYYKGKRAEPGTYIWQLSYIDPWSFKKVFENGTSILLR